MAEKEPHGRWCRGSMFIPWSPSSEITLVTAAISYLSKLLQPLFLLSPPSQVSIRSWYVVTLSLVCLGSRELTPFHLLLETPVQWKALLNVDIITIYHECQLNWRSSHGHATGEVSWL